MRRRLFNFAAVVSLVLCLATVVLWVRSYWVIDEITLAMPHLNRMIAGGGGVFLESVRYVRVASNWQDSTIPPSQTIMDYANWKLSGPGRVRSWERRTKIYTDRADLVRLAWGTDLNRIWPHSSAFSSMLQQTFNNDERLTYTQFTDSVIGHRIWIPYWLLVAACSLCPLIFLLNRQRLSNRLGRNACSICGYNLTGNTSGVCPECGTPVAGKAGANAGDDGCSVLPPLCRCCFAWRRRYRGVAPTQTPSVRKVT